MSVWKIGVMIARSLVYVELAYGLHWHDTYLAVSYA